MTGCTVGTPGGGGPARAGRATLRTDLTTTAPSVPGGCDCARCCPPPLTHIEAQRALRHVSDVQAAAYGRGELSLVSLHGCRDCDEWMPTLADAAMTTR